MTSKRLEALSDGVIAIIITIMVLELEAPEETSLESLGGIYIVFISYLMSFLYVSIYWDCHHQLFKIAERIDRKILWANLHLLFWLSLIPFTTEWIGKDSNHTTPIPIVLYGFVLLMCEVSFIILKASIIRCYGKDSIVSLQLNNRSKDILYLIIYAIGLSLAFVGTTYLSIGCFLILGISKVINNKVHILKK